jgi:hypothetical protein
MSKLTIALSAVVLAGCASTSGWRALHIDGSSQASFEASVASIQQALPASRREYFDVALADVWIKGTLNADAADYTADDYFRQLDGLQYDGVVALAPDATQLLYRSASARAQRLTSEPASAPSAGFREGPQIQRGMSNPFIEFQQDHAARSGSN